MNESSNAAPASASSSTYMLVPILLLFLLLIIAVLRSPNLISPAGIGSAVIVLTPLALATYAFALAVPQLLKYKNIEGWTGGVQGIVLTKPEPPISFSFLGQPFSADRWLYVFTLAVAALMFLVAWNLLRGRVGRAMIAIRDHPIAATAMGINLPVFKSVTFGVSAAFTGVAGALGAICVAFVSPDSFTVFLSITFLVGVVVGGLASIPGAIFGAIFIQFVPNVAEEISKSAPWAIYGVVLIAIMYMMPSGVMGLLKKIWAAMQPATRVDPVQKS